VDEAAALRATIAAYPEADLPRLVYADWLEDGGDDGQAAFLRTQVQLAHEPAWSPLAVRCRHRTPEVLTGKPWRHTLPPVSERIAAWHPETPFRRGAPDWLVVRDLASFLDDAGRLFDLAPITTLSLPTSSLDYWQDFARQPWLRQVRALHFYGVSTPIEPLRVLGNAVNASGVKELTLERTSGPAFPVVLNDLFRSDLGNRLKRLDLRAGGDNGGEWLEAFEHLRIDGPLDSLTLRTMELGGDGMSRLTESPVFHTLRRFRTHNDLLPHHGLQMLLSDQSPKKFEDLAFVNFQATRGATRIFGESPTMRGVRRLDLSGNALYDLVDWGSSTSLTHLKSLSLKRCRLRREAIGQLVSTACWPLLTELDLRANRFSDSSLVALLDAEPPTELAALVLNGIRVKREFVTKLQDHFRGAVVFDDRQ
jgi:uncharacterized protein (TIGR02996 family)